MVKADEDIEIITIPDAGTWSAFKFFQLYGWESDFSNTETQIYESSESSVITGEFNFSGQFNGSLAANVSLTGTGTIQTGSQGNTFWSSTSESGLMYDDSFHGIEMTITPSANGATNDYNATYACTYYPNTTAAVSTMTCTPDYSTYSQPLTLPEQTITIDEIRFNTAGSIQTDLFLSLLHEGTEVGSMTGSLSGNIGGGGQITLGATSTGTIETENNTRFEFTMPYMEMPNGRWNKQSAYDSKFLITGSASDPFVVAWIADRNIMQFMKFYVANNNRQIVATDKWSYNYKYIVGGSDRFQVDWMETRFSAQYLDVVSFANIEKIYPLYVGYKSRMSDELYRFIYGSDRQVEAIDAQTAADQQHHDEMMDTSDSAQISTDGNALVDDADEKFGDLFFPLQHAVDTAHDLANVNATGVIRLPAIFKDDYWYLDLTVIERNLPQAWAFIQSLCQLAVAIYMIKGLYNLFFGGGKEDDS